MQIHSANTYTDHTSNNCVENGSITELISTFPKYLEKHICLINSLALYIHVSNPEYGSINICPELKLKEKK